ncbi:fibronectin type III domain-containing protein [Paenibacillus chitinolyticus]|uniref:fibronectin type III domain-containing protein n=1 Tax=Paenibacillus chitinolyticus TaxID=79263 RepID=UPI002DBBBB4F|nr:fibronectin type III domain-containing protein [Paenibacillus chitinolyticus]MEC0248696.1 fibronectin type III domain-containing protein [Paenibacillus chitinolyticus]
MRGYILICKWFFLISVVMLFFSFQSSVYAAAVGDKLITPETGWIRFDDKDPLVKRSNGTWGFVPSMEPTQTYQGGYYYSKDKGAKISFSFTGTKFRLIAPIYKLQSSDITVKVDGVVVDKYSTYSATQLIHQAIVYESALEDGKHDIEIINNDAGKELEVDAIDLYGSGKLVDINAPLHLNATGGDSQVTLSWNAVKNSDSYTIRYGTNSGNYTQTVIATKDVYGHYAIPNLVNGTTYYFVVTATVNGVESGFSNEASATPQAGKEPNPNPSVERAILTIYLTNGTEKEYDLSMTEVNSFISWYDAKDLGGGPAKYKFVKTWNKGPFKNRTEYIIFDKILTFNVDEY